MARKTALKVVLGDDVREHLLGLLRASKTPAGLARRARAILLVAGGESLVGAGRQAGMDVRHVRKWVKRFLKDGLKGLDDGKRSGRPPSFSP